MIIKYEYYATSEQIKKIRKEVKLLANNARISVSTKSIAKDIEPKILTLEHKGKSTFNITDQDLQDKSNSLHIFQGYCDDLKKRLFSNSL